MVMQLNYPQHDFAEVLDQCEAGITGNANLLQRLRTCRGDLEKGHLQYVNAASTGELYKIKALDTTHDKDPTVLNDIKKSELIKIYDQYFVAENKPARKIYEALLNAAKEKCPFCGGIGTPRNLDHFLPKAHFPQFSVLPHNLVPSCRDCNMDAKGHSFAAAANEQIIQPYVDKLSFFTEQWIFAKYHAFNFKDVGEFEYFVICPNTWSVEDKQKAERHFSDFNLARRYGTKAAEHLGTFLRQITSLYGFGLGTVDVKDSLLQPGIDAAPFANHWQRGMYQALWNALK